MKKTQKITRSNYQRLIKNTDADLDFVYGSTRFSFVNKDGFTWSYRFYKLANGYYQTYSRLGHQKERPSFCGSLVTIFDYIIES